jgi:hypothetical protein
LRSKSYKELGQNAKDAEDWLISHISNVESTMVGFFAIAVTFLLFPLALYTPEVPYLLHLATLGYICSWGFMYSIIAGICMRISSIENKWEIDYSKSIQDLTGNQNLAKTAVKVIILSSIFMMAIPPIYISIILLLVGSNIELVFTLVSMTIICILGISTTYRLAKRAI